jgi:hypothetical protein
MGMQCMHSREGWYKKLKSKPLDEPRKVYMVGNLDPSQSWLTSAIMCLKIEVAQSLTIETVVRVLKNSRTQSLSPTYTSRYWAGVCVISA